MAGLSKDDTVALKTLVEKLPLEEWLSGNKDWSASLAPVVEFMKERLLPAAVEMLCTLARVQTTRSL